MITDASADDNSLKSIDVLELEVAADSPVSPNGSRAVHFCDSKDILADRSVANVWMVDTDGINHRSLLSGAQAFSGPRWPASDERRKILKMLHNSTHVYLH